MTITSTTPCACCGDCESITGVNLECRTKTGTAALCGFSEYGDPSLPPKKYIRETRRRIFSFPNFTDPSCTTPKIVRAYSPPASGSQLLSGDLPGIFGAPQLYQGVVNWEINGPLVFTSFDRIVSPGYGGLIFFQGGEPVGGWAIRSIPTEPGTYSVAAFMTANGNFPGSPNPADYITAGVGTYTIADVQEVDSSDQSETREYADDCAPPAESALPDLGFGGTCELGPLETTPTQLQKVATGACCARPSGGGFRSAASATYSDELSLEDTEAAAIARIDPAPTWTPWVGGNDITCLAYIDERGPGVFTFGFQEAEWRHRIIGAPAGKEFRITVTYFRRARGTLDPLEVYATETVSGSTDVSGNLTLDGVVPGARGWDTIVGLGSLCAVRTGGGGS
jgi:hypothetical protein